MLSPQVTLLVRPHPSTLQQKLQNTDWSLHTSNVARQPARVAEGHKAAKLPVNSMCNKELDLNWIATLPFQMLCLGAFPLLWLTYLALHSALTQWRFFTEMRGLMYQVLGNLTRIQGYCLSTCRGNEVHA
jgi:hypothetical protein